MEKKRYRYIDVIRGTAVLLMVLYHGGFSLILYGYLPAVLLENPIMMVLETAGAAVFVIVSGVSSGFSHSNVKRGIKILICAALVTAATYWFDSSFFVRFGILHFLGVATLLQGLLGKQLKKIPSCPLMLIGIFIVLKILMPAAYAVDGLAWLGFPNFTFASSDYFPIIPWIFAYLAGVQLTAYIQQEKTPGWMSGWNNSFLEFVGKNALPIYILHQPIIVGFLELYSKLSA